MHRIRLTIDIGTLANERVIRIAQNTCFDRALRYIGLHPRICIAVLVGIV